MTPDPFSAARRPRRHAVVCLLVLAAGASVPAVQPAFAQSTGASSSADASSADPSARPPVVPAPGEEVRVVQRGVRGAVHGLYVEAANDELLLSSIRGGGPVRIALDDVTGIAVQRGQRSRGLTGSLLGLGLGVAAGIALGQSGDVFDDTVTAVGVSAGVGLPLGLIVGLLIRSPDWDGVDLPALRAQGSAAFIPSPEHPVRYRPARGR